MSLNRRSLLQCAGAGCAVALLPLELAAATALRRYQVQDAVARPRFTAGDVVVADTAVSGFIGSGLYLYPAWGQPRLYAVQEAAGGLAFRNPGSGQVLWTQSARLDAEFAGKILDTRHDSVLADCPALSVPALPATA